MADPSSRDKNKESSLSIDRRDFLKMSGYVVVGIGTGWGVSACVDGDGQSIIPDGDREMLQPSQGYVLVDSKKCQGCLSCMLACSLVNEGKASLSLARLQVIVNTFSGWPGDVEISQCRQCQEPLCVKGCPSGALSIDAEHGFVRKVDKDICIGCGTCVESCPYTPSRPLVAPDEDYLGEDKSRKCDLCASAKYHFDAAGGGPQGKQACVSVCPVGAITFSHEMPAQKGDGGYKINLRDESWSQLGYTNE